MTQPAAVAEPIPTRNPQPSGRGLGAVLVIAFGLDARSRVLVGGRGVDALLDELRGVPDGPLVDRMGTESGRTSHRYDLIVINGGDDMREVPRMLAATAALAEDGCVVLCGRNRFALLDVRRLRFAAGRHRWTMSRFTRAAQSAGLPWAETFYCQLSKGIPTEVYSESLRHLDLPAHYPASFRIASAWGVYPHLAESYVVVAAKTSTNRFSAFRRALTSGGSPGGNDGSIVRAMLRSRGTFVLEAQGAAARPEMIVRIGLNPTVERNLRANQYWADRVRQLFAQQQLGGDSVPRFEGTVALGGAVAYREEKRRGILGWQLPQDAAIRTRLDRDLARFLNDLARASHRTVTMNDDTIHQLLASDFEALPPLYRKAPELLPAVREMVQRLAAANRGRRVSLVISHGDFGLGNVLADPGTGALEGVIDWDCARDDSPLWLDWANLLVQRELAPTAALAFAAVSARVMRDDSWRPLDAGEAGLHACDARTLLTILAIRFVARDCRFRDELDGSWVDFRDILNHAAQLWARA